MSGEPLVSASWHRVATLRPSLASGARVVRQPSRDLVWHVLVEPATGRQMRLNPTAYEIVGRLDGRATVGELWQRTLASRGDQAPSQDEVMRLLSQLFGAGLVQFDAAPNLSMLFANRETQVRQRRRGVLNPLVLRMPLLDPQPLLDRLRPLAELLFGRAALSTWLALVLAAGFVALLNASELRSQAAHLMASPRALVTGWLVYPVMKLLHELAHGLALRRFGGEVREAGISLVFLVPSPYVDASSASAFPSARERMVVSSAGLLAESAIASLALLAWVLLEPGVLRDTALVAALIGSVSTFVFNANPLVRLDGYHVLCDALQLPNLATRSQAWWLRLLAGLAAPQRRPAAATLMAGERKWLAAYAPASLAYRLAVLVAIVSWAGTHNWLLGMALLVAAVAWTCAGAWRWLAAAGSRAQRVGAGITVALGAVVLFVPMPQAVVVPGIVWPAAPNQVRTDTPGFVHAVVAADGQAVAVGDPVLELQDADLLATVDRLAAERDSIRARQYKVLLSDPSASMQLQADLDRAEAELARAQQRQEQLVVRAGSAGRMAWARPQDLPGSYAKRGALLGHVVEPASAAIKLALAEDDFLLLRGRVRSVDVRLVSLPRTEVVGQWTETAPGATRDLPSAALGDRQGGAIPVEAANALKARVRVFLVDVPIPAVPGATSLVGQRAWAKLQLPSEPLAVRWWLRVRQALLRQLSPDGQL